MKLLEDKIGDYIKAHSSPEPQIFRNLQRKTNLLTTQPRMLSGHIQGLILKMIVEMMGAKRIAEIGTFTGYSALWMASGMRTHSDAQLHTIDINDEISYIAEEAFKESEYGDIIHQHIGSAIDVIPQIGGVFDLVFMDGDKREYIEYYNMLMDGGFLRSGSVILADNVLWDGKVVDDSQKNLNDKHTSAILAFNELVSKDDRVEVVIMPFRDGMSMIRIK